MYVRAYTYRRSSGRVSVACPAMDPAALIHDLEIQGTHILDLVSGADLEKDVPTCPGWTLRDLVLHLGGIHRWAATYVSEQRVSAIRMDLEELVGGWPADDDLVEWFADGLGSLVAALRTAPTDLQCFTFLDAPSPLHMWSRRQAHETAIHRVDAEASFGRRVVFDPAFAADGIDELLRCFLTRWGRGPRADTPRLLEVVAIDVGSRWRVVFDDQTCRIDDGAAPADAVIEGEASTLYQLLWNRVGPDSVQVHGDPIVMGEWRESAHVRWS